MKNGTAREMLSSLMWRPDRDIGLVKVTYVHRGAPDDMASVHGKDIVSMSELFMLLSRDGKEVQVPFHRIRSISYDGEVVFTRG